MNLSFARTTLDVPGALVIGAWEGRRLAGRAAEADRAAGGAIRRALEHARFEGKPGQALTILAPAKIKASRIVLLGLGDPKDFTELAAAKHGGAAVAQVAMSGETRAALVIDVPKRAKVDAATTAAQAALGARLRSYRFDKYRTKEKKDEKPSLARMTVMCDAPDRARSLHKRLDALADGVFITRDLVSEPPNVLNPPSYAKEIRRIARDGLKVEVLSESRLRTMGMGALVGVGAGSQYDSQLVVLQWNGARRAGERPVAFVGKGVTFDTGGISIKPSQGMEDMKWDMGGSAVVVGLMTELARRKAKVNAVGVVGLVENMPSGSAQRPGDVVTSYSGQTIEILNTDAEGRLVLADALWYTQKRFKPKFMVDLATLTGAIIVSLGNYRAGLFANDETLSKRLVAAGDEVGEPVWPMPMDDSYDKLLKSDIADVKNIGGRAGGSVTAAKFLEHFVNDVPWAHLDIAGVTWTREDSELVPKGGSAFGVRLLDRLVESHYEAK
jgi:leucyl aminopeptidase